MLKTRKLWAQKLVARNLGARNLGVGNPGAKKLGAKNLEARILRARNLGLGTWEKVNMIQGSWGSGSWSSVTWKPGYQTSFNGECYKNFHECRKSYTVRVPGANFLKFWHLGAVNWFPYVCVSEVSPAPEIREISRIREFSGNSTENSTEFLCYFETDT